MRLKQDTGVFPESRTKLGRHSYSNFRLCGQLLQGITFENPTLLRSSCSLQASTKQLLSLFREQVADSVNMVVSMLERPIVDLRSVTLPIAPGNLLRNALKNLDD